MSLPDDPAQLFQAGAWTTSNPWQPPAPETLQIRGVEIVAFAGRGGAGAVYEGFQPTLERRVAVKLLPPEMLAQPAARERFFLEARTLAALKHPHIVGIYEVGEINASTPYFIMEWLENGDLSKQIATGPVSLELARKWIRQISEGLEYAHQKGVIHRDLKPRNLLLDQSGHVKLSDFGLATQSLKPATTNLTLSGVNMGTVEYMAPEQLAGDHPTTTQSDIYALGVLSYELLTGQRPRGAFAPASTLSAAPKALDKVINRALAAKADRRYPSARSFQTAFETAVRRPHRIRLLALLSVLLAIVLVYLFKLDQAAEPSAQLGPVPRNSPAATPTSEVSIEQAAPWIPVLRLIEPKRDGTLWRHTEAGLQSNNERAILRIPLDPGISYDLRASFTRLSGEHSVAFFLPTSAGPLSFELDAWGIGIGGIQNLDGRDMRNQFSHFTAEIENGVRQDVLIEVRADSIRCFWNGSPVLSETLTGKVFSLHQLWKTASPAALPGVGSWKSPTVFHSIEIRSTEQ